MTRADIVARIRREVDGAGSQAALARRWGLSPGYLHDVLAGRTAPGPRILERLGLRLEVAYRART